MIFNKYVWELYKESKAGRKKIDYYRRFDIKDAVDIVLTNHADTFEPDSDDLTPIDFCKGIMDIFVAYLQNYNIGVIEEAREIFDIIINQGIPINEDDEDGEEAFYWGGKDHLSFIYRHIDLFSMALFMSHPEYFFPYLFYRNFVQFEQIANLFNISLPKLPGRRNDYEKVMYYWQLNQSLQEFRSIHELSPHEMYAFLYDFAVKCLESSSDHELPEPSKVWMSGASEGDFGRLDNANDKSRYYWSGSRYAKRGDIQIVYCFNPRKHIHSIWRIPSDGFVDPFYYYFDTIWISNPILLKKPIGYSELKADPVWQKFGRLQAGMQGLSGDRITVDQYHALLNLIKKKGQDISNFPYIQDDDSEIPDVNDERDVELKLIEPLLNKLDFKESDWKRQVSIRMGTGNCYYPDYAIGFNPKKDEETVTMLIEAKYDIPGEKALQEAYAQAQTYARRLQAEIFIVASRNGIWVFQSSGNSFNIGKFTHKTWKQLKSKDEISALSVSIGRKAVLK